MLTQPKPYLEKLRLRNHSFGTEQRRNMSKLILEHGTPLPLPIEYSDIDQTMFKWVEDNIKIVYDGKRLPVYKLYSTQRLNEYIQSWDKQDENGNPIINFLTVTRDLNPQKGENQGNYFNIPGHKNFVMFYVPVLQENGTEAYDKYTMKQPTQINFIYSISIISNKIEIINKASELMHYEFSAIDCYISPNNHPMSMTLEDISDESEYTIDDRKYYSQTYKIKVKGYIIRKEDYKVERIPSRLIISSHDSDASGIVSKRGKNRKNEDKVKFLEGFEQDINKIMNEDNACEPIAVVEKEKPSEIYDSEDVQSCIEEPSECYNKIVKIMVHFDECESKLTFTIDKDVALDEIETSNVQDFKLIVNGELIDLEGDVNFFNNDEITLEITRDDFYKDSDITLVCHDPNVAFDKTKIAESSLDEPIDEEHILVNYNKEEKTD